MPNYLYRCPWCGDEFYKYFQFADSNTIVYCGHDGVACDKVLGVAAFHRAMPEHFNHSVGKYVSNEREFRDDLKRASDEASQRLGLPHNFVPIDMRDPAQTHATEEGLDATHRQQTATGQREAKKWY